MHCLLARWPREWYLFSILPPAQSLAARSFRPERLGSGTFDVRLRAANTDNEFGPWSRIHHIVLPEIHRPRKPIPTLAIGRTHDATPTFQWSQDASTRHVELSVVSTETGQEVSRIKQIRETSHTLQQPLPSGSYVYNLQAWNEFGERSGWTRARAFQVEVGLPTQTPFIRSPRADVTQDSTPIFAWSAIEHGSQYRLTVTDENGDIVIDKMGLTSTIWSPRQPLAKGTYRVHVVGSNELGQSSPSSISVEFLVDAARPERPRMLGPATTTNPRPLFTWSAQADVVEYQLWVSNETTGVNRYMRLTSITSTFAHANIDFTPGNYKAWVKAINVDGDYRWSSALNFTVDSSIAAIDGQLQASVAMAAQMSEFDDVVSEEDSAENSESIIASQDVVVEAAVADLIYAEAEELAELLLQA